MKTKVILKEDVASLGMAGEVVEVTPGYARNFLLPRGKAWPHSADYLVRVDKVRREAEERRAALLKEVADLAERLAAVQLTFEEKAAETGHLYGSVNAQRIAEALAGQGLEIPERDVRLAEPLKDVGEYAVPVHLHGETEATVKVWVVAARAAEA